MRRTILPITLSLAMLAGSGALASDQIYKCVDPNGATVLSDKPCAVIESVPADTAPVGDATATGAVSGDGATLPAIEPGRPQVVKEHYTLPAAEVDQSQRARTPLYSASPKVDVATLKAARLKLELEDRSGPLRQASLD
ncbi:MAG TPA: DUF4124 domain-containing protein [Pseudoduganella sp.]|jgi:hypothetical protein